MPFTIDHARALHCRLDLGESWIDHDGHEHGVPKGKARPPREPVPSVEVLLKKYGHNDPGMNTDSGPSGLPSEEAIRARSLARHEADAARNREEIAASVALTMASLRTRAEARVSLPCYELDPMAHEGAGDDPRAAAACEAVKAHRTCGWSHDPVTCPRVRMDTAYDRRLVAMRRAVVPAIFSDRILASLHGHRQDGRRMPPVVLETRPAVALVTAWLSRKAVTVDPWSAFRGDETILILVGHKGGEGKSFASAVACSLEADDAKWTTAAALAEVRADAYDRTAFIEPALLAIDDAGTEPLTEWSRGRMFAVMSDRHAAKRLTLVTTNMESRPAFCTRYDERLDRRITESGRWLRLGAWVP